MTTSRVAVLAALAVGLLTLSARAAEKVELRAAEHRGYGRIAIQWPSPVAYQAKVEGKTLTIHFARPFAAALGAIERRLAYYVSGAAQSADGTTIFATLRRPVAIRSFVVNRDTIAIDLVASRAKGEAKPASLQRMTARKLPSKPASQKPTPQPAQARKSRRAKATTLPAKAGSKPPPAAPAEAATGAESKAATPAAAKKRAVRSGSIAFAPRLVTDGGQTSLRFDWPMPTAAAVYRRDGALWIVFDAHATLDLDAMRAQDPGLFSKIEKISAGSGTALRLVTTEEVYPAVRRVGNSWLIDLKATESAPEAPVLVEPRPGAHVPSVDLHVHQSGAPLRLRDPVIGDRLIVVPVASLGRGIDATRRFVDFRLLRTEQGIVIRPNTDDLTVVSDADAVEITEPGGLVLSGERDLLFGSAPAVGQRLFDFIGWRGPAGQSFIDRRSLLDRAAADAEPAARTAPRLELAHFYFAHLFGAETIGVLEQVERDDPVAAARPGVEALMGAACYLQHELSCAQQKLGVAALDNVPEAALWRGAVAAAREEWRDAARDFMNGIGLLSSYPKALRDRFALDAAQALIETGRASTAGPLIDLVMEDSPTRSDRAMAEYLKGRRDQALGALRPALAIWKKVAATGDRRARARAHYARVMALYRSKKASRLQTINALDALRFAWRGDGFEFRLLRELGKLQLAEGDVDDGIETLHDAATYFPNYPGAKEVTKEAADSFANLFLGKGAKDLPPIKALALYNEFNDLEPVGPRRDAIVKKLIDRLVSVDLLDQAAALLQDQVENRLAGYAKARGATQLALLDLMNRRPKAAVAALDIEVGADLPTDLARQRLELRARALTAINEAPQALALLKRDKSVDAARLRADIYWHQKDWKDAAQIFSELAGTPPAQGPLGISRSRIVLAWAAALTLDGDQRAVDKLRKDWGPAIAGTQTAQAFNLITANPEAVAGGGSAADIAARIADIGNLQSFMAAYRQRLASDGLAAIN